MFDFIDKWMEEELGNRLKKNCEKIIDDEISIFIKRHPEMSPELLKMKIVTEIDHRLFPMVEESILKERIIRAKYTFWSASFAGPMIVGMLTGFSGPLLPFFAPMITAFIYWVVSMVLTPISVKKRLEGGAKSVREMYERSLEVEDAKQSIVIVPIKEPQNTPPLDEFKKSAQCDDEQAKIVGSDFLQLSPRGFFPAETQRKNDEDDDAKQANHSPKRLFNSSSS